jgi:hypothetical protein
MVRVSYIEGGTQALKTRTWAKYLGPKVMKIGSGKDLKVINVIAYTIYLIYSERINIKEEDG